MSKFYPDIERLFDNLKGRKPRYKPEDLCEEFKRYIKNLEDNPIKIDTDYRAQGDDNSRRQQRRTQNLTRPPKINDFVTRWLGMTRQWWYSLPNGARGDEYAAVIERITQYCYDVKFDGAVVGIYNANIIARDLGLNDNIKVTTQAKTEAEIDEELERLKEYGKQMGYL